MTPSHLPEYTTAVRQTLDLANREASHLRYTVETLFSLPLDLDWVKSLDHFTELVEKIDAFVAWLGRLQDHLGENLHPAFARLLAEPQRSLIDTLSFAERTGWIPDGEALIHASRGCVTC